MIKIDKEKIKKYIIKFMYKITVDGVIVGLIALIIVVKYQSFIEGGFLQEDLLGTLFFFLLLFGLFILSQKLVEEDETITKRRIEDIGEGIKEIKDDINKLKKEVESINKKIISSASNIDKSS